MAIIVVKHPSELTWGALVVVLVVDVGAYSFLKDFYSDRE
jgi:hypothetical protein